MRRKDSNSCLSFWAVFLLIILLFTTCTPYYANSAQTQWRGVDATGAMVTDKDSPIVVEKEVLTFDISEFPSNYYRDLDEYLAYSGKVTAEYTFYNPSDYTVTATLLFPYGKVPDYGSVYDRETGEYVYNAADDKYAITVDGEEVETTIRHTLSSSGEQFDLERDLPKIVDELMEDDFYKSSTPVYCITYEVSDIEQKNAVVGFEWSGDPQKTKIYVSGQDGYERHEDGARISQWTQNNETITIWIIGEYENLPQWTVYKNGKCEETISGKVELDSKSPIQKMTFYDFAMSDYNSESGILMIDWYMAKLDSLKSNELSYGIIRGRQNVVNIEGSFMRWYEYEITLEPGQRIVNTVTAPMYPDINLNYEPDIYSYTYLLSPATTWKEFGTLDIILNTPYYITVSSVEGYVKTEKGYQWSLSGLPEGELEFTLCTEPNPRAPMTVTSVFETILNQLYNSIFSITIIVVVVVLLAVSVIMFFKMKKRKVTKDDN